MSIHWNCTATLRGLACSDMTRMADERGFGPRGSPHEVSQAVLWQQAAAVRSLGPFDDKIDLQTKSDFMIYNVVI